jgi:hypothetical protein
MVKSQNAFKYLIPGAQLMNFDVKVVVEIFYDIKFIAVKYNN